MFISNELGYFIFVFAMMWGVLYILQWFENWLETRRF
jgi:hypothetical protein